MIRVYQNPDGTVRVFHPNQKLPFDEACARAEQADPTLAGLLFVDVDDDALPVERERETGGRAYNVRSAWRLSGRTVIVDESKVEAKETAR